MQESEKKSNRHRFVVLAEKRVTKAIKHIRLVGNLANRSNYSYSAEEAKKIVATLEREVKNLRKRFESAQADEEIRFKL